ncbi:LysR family transcriptional regulator [Celerinatantimonas sp. MCCC 1A17872]|uniref:LysR family transcriptional regulator n=1 Tax=Celerinatantimonas sp. MCCC 1A17872 TaxID=3177514 RepID=UPI0038CBA903
MDKFESMRRFIAVAQTGSFTRASEQLGVPKSAISASVSALEVHLQTRLLFRNTRRVSLTEAGGRFLGQCQRLLDELEGLENQFQKESNQLSGVIKVDMPSRFFSNIVAPQLHKWFEMHPLTQIELLGADYRIDPIQEQVDCVIRAGTLDDSNLVGRSLGLMPMVNCVSASYAKRYGIAQSLDELNEHYIVEYAADVRQQKTGFEYVESDKLRRISVRYLISVSTTDAYLAACLNGLGIVQLPRGGVTNYLKSGELVEVLPDYQCAPMPLSILYESRHQQPRRLSEFIDWLMRLFSDDKIC